MLNRPRALVLDRGKRIDPLIADELDLLQMVHSHGLECCPDSCNPELHGPLRWLSQVHQRGTWTPLQYPAIQHRPRYYLHHHLHLDIRLGLKKSLAGLPKSLDMSCSSCPCGPLLSI